MSRSDYTAEELQAMRDWLKEQVAVTKALYPMMAEVSSEDVEEIRRPLLESIRGCEKDGDVEVLSMVASWFILGASKSTLLALIAFLEDSDDDEV